MKLMSLFATILLALLIGLGPSHAAVFTFDFEPLSGDYIQSTGTFTTDDAPSVSSITSVTGIVNGLNITSIDPSGINITVTDELDKVSAYFSFLASYNGIDYSLSFGPSAFESYALSASGSDGSEFQADGDLRIAPGMPTGLDPVSPVPLPASAPLFGAAILALGVLGYRTKRKKIAVPA